MKRILYYGHFDRPSDCENWIANALTRAGHQVFRWQRRIGDLKFTVVTYPEFSAMLDYCVQNQIDMFLFNKAQELKVDWLHEMRRLGIEVVMWTFDWMVPHGDWFYPQARACDVVFMTDGYDADGTYKREGFTRVELHQGYDVDVHDCRWEEPADEYDGKILFLGSEYTNRRTTLIRALWDRWGERFVHVGGRNALKEGLWGKDFSVAVGSAAIIIGDNYTNDVPGYWSDRVYLTLACGGFFLASWVEGLDRRFEIGNHLDTWYDFNDLNEKISHYLSDASPSVEIRKNGMRFVRERHSYDNRVKHMMEVLGGE